MAAISTNVFVFWGGEIQTTGAPPKIHYSLDVQAVIPIQTNIGINPMEYMIRRAMGINIEDPIDLMGRVILDATMGITHYLLHIARERDWEYFIQQTLPHGELHVYVQTQDIYGGGFGITDVDPPEELPSSSTMVESSSETDETYEPESIPSERSASTDAEDIEESLPFDFESMAETAQMNRGRGQRIPDSAIPSYHSPIPPRTTTFTYGFTERDDDETLSYDPSTNVITVGMVFPDFSTLKKAVATYNMHHKREYITNHKKRANWKVSCPHYKSTPSCPWTLSAKKLHGASSEWQVTKFFQPHECTVQYNQGPADKLCTSSLICDLIFQKIAADPQYKVKHIQVDVRQQYGVDISYRKAWYARHKCIEMQYGNYQHSYNELPQFCRKLQLSNPGTIVELLCTPSEEWGTEYVHFLYAFWAFKPAIDGFRYCIPVICVDGTHLYNQYKGHLLLACGYTANKEIYPLAYSIVDSENNASWSWFLRLLAKHVFPHHNSMCIISDRHAGIEAAFNSVEELKGGRVKRRFCLRHIRSNVLTKVTRNRRLRKLIWEAGTAVTRNQFLQHMQTIQLKWPTAYAYLADIDEEKWTLSHDDGHRYGIMTTNPSESLNNSLKCCRMLPVTAIVRMTFHKLRTMFADRRTAGEGMLQHGLHFTPKITDDLSARNNEARGASIQRFNDTLGIYGVALSTGYVSQSQQNHFQVNLTERTCNCGLWNVNGIPCAHVIAACNYRGEGFSPFVQEVYSVQNYRNCYAGNFYPVDERTQWTSSVTCLPPISARPRNQRGQRRTRRFPNEMDFGRNRSTRCKYCRRTTHSSEHCPTLNH